MSCSESSSQHRRLEISDFDQDSLVELLGDTGQAPPATVNAIQHHGLAALLDGTPVTTTRVAELSGLSRDDIEKGIRALVDIGRIELDEDRVVGVGGLTVTETVHSVTLPNAEMHTWCALDAVGIPAAMRLKAKVNTRCPHCSAEIDVDVDHGDATAAGAVTLFCPTGPCGNVRADFCSAAHLFCNPTHLAQWRAANPSVLGEALDLPATVQLGHAMWGRHRG